MANLYDASGAPLGMQYRTANTASSVWQTYWYERDLLNNIVAVYNHNGSKLVSYTYDAWGNFTTTYHNGGASTKAADNPFTYRGYFYEKYLNLYYLGTRYYDSKICRFINADKVMSGVSASLKGYNLFAYCFNDPINMTDSEGNWPECIEDAYTNVKGWITSNIVDPISGFIGKVKDDFDNYDKGNKSEQVVLDSNFFSNYNGVFVLRIPGRNAFSFGIIVLGKDENSITGITTNDVKHEYGHRLQLDNMGWGAYIKNVALPSVTFYWLDKMDKVDGKYYYSAPWEAEADILGKVKRKRNEDNTPWPEDYPTTFGGLIKMFWK